MCAVSRVVFTSAVDDVGPTCVELIGHRVELLNGPMDRPRGIRTASFVDPSGSILEIAKWSSVGVTFVSQVMNRGIHRLRTAFHWTLLRP